jgi:hypothetical protein
MYTVDLTALPTPLLISVVGGISISMTYGIQIKESNDPFIAIAEEALKSVPLAMGCVSEQGCVMNMPQRADRWRSNGVTWAGL